jgi:hypothetical protein
LFCHLKEKKKTCFEHFNIFENTIISAKTAQGSSSDYFLWRIFAICQDIVSA